MGRLTAMDPIEIAGELFDRARAIGFRDPRRVPVLFPGETNDERASKELRPARGGGPSLPRVGRGRTLRPIRRGRALLYRAPAAERDGVAPHRARARSLDPG